MINQKAAVFPLPLNMQVGEVEVATESERTARVRAKRVRLGSKVDPASVQNVGIKLWSPKVQIR